MVNQIQILILTFILVVLAFILHFDEVYRSQTFFILCSLSFISFTIDYASSNSKSIILS